MTLGLLLTTIGGCAPAPSAARSAAPSVDQGEPRPPKVLTLVIQKEPNTLHYDVGPGGDVVRGGGTVDVMHITHEYLVVEDDRGRWVPRLAGEQLSVEKGTWRLNPDGTMDTVWKLLPNVRWHDGTPFTSDDLLFAFNVKKDPAVPYVWGAAVRLMQSAAAPDPLTFVIHWSSTFVDADQALALTPMPRHLLYDLYEAQKAEFVNSARFTTEFIGLGPYKLVNWESASHIEFARFDDYFRGRPPLDRVIVRFSSDPNAIVASMLSDAADLMPPTSLDVELALEVRRRWEGTGNIVHADLNGRLNFLEIQHRPELAQPRNGLTNTLVRRAFLHGIDRPTLVEVMTQGLAPVADSWFPPDHELRSQLESAIPQFPYDLARAQTVLAQAGWVRSSDGVLTHQSSGERFEVMLASLERGGGTEKLLNTIADGWKTLGARVNLNVIPSVLSRNEEYRVQLPGLEVRNLPYNRFYRDRNHSRSVASEANRWTGVNYGGYGNPKVDALLDALNVTIDPQQRLFLHRELLQEQLGDLPNLPLYWLVDPVLALKGVKGIKPRGLWNFFEYDKD